MHTCTILISRAVRYWVVYMGINPFPSFQQPLAELFSIKQRNACFSQRDKIGQWLTPAHVPKTNLVSHL